VLVSAVPSAFQASTFNEVGMNVNRCKFPVNTNNFVSNGINYYPTHMNNTTRMAYLYRISRADSCLSTDLEIVLFLNLLNSFSACSKSSESDPL